MGTRDNLGDYESFSHQFPPNFEQRHRPEAGPQGQPPPANQQQQIPMTGIQQQPTAGQQSQLRTAALGHPLQPPAGGQQIRCPPTGHLPPPFAQGQYRHLGSSHQHQYFAPGYQQPLTRPGQHQTYSGHQQQFPVGQHHLQIAGRPSTPTSGQQQYSFIAGHQHLLAGQQSPTAGHQLTGEGQRQSPLVASQIPLSVAGHQPLAQIPQERLRLPSSVVIQPHRFSPGGHHSHGAGRQHQPVIPANQPSAGVASPFQHPAFHQHQQRPSVTRSPYPQHPLVAMSPHFDPGRPYPGGEPALRTASPSCRGQQSPSAFREGPETGRIGSHGADGVAPQTGGRDKQTVTSVISGTSLLPLIPEDDTLGLGLINPNEVTAQTMAQYKTPADLQHHVRSPAVSSPSLGQTPVPPPPPPPPPPHSSPSSLPRPPSYPSSNHPSPLVFSPSQLSPLAYSPPTPYPHPAHYPPSSLSPFSFAPEFQQDPKSSAKSPGREKVGLAKPSESSKYRAIREQNNAASRRYREAQRGQRNLQEEHLTRLLKENQDLRARAADLEKLRNAFKDILESL